MSISSQLSPLSEEQQVKYKLEFQQALDVVRNRASVRDNPDTLLRSLLDLLRTRFRADAAALLLLDEAGNEFDLLTVAGISEDTAGRFCRMALELTELDYVHKGFRESVLGFKMLQDDIPQAIGSLILARTEPFGEQEFEQLQLVEDSLISAIIQARVVYELANQNRQLEAIYTFDRLCDETWAEGELISGFMTLLGEYFRVDLCMIIASDTHSGDLVLRSIIDRYNLPPGSVDDICRSAGKIHMMQLLDTPSDIEDLILLAAPLNPANADAGVVILGRDNGFSAAERRLLHAVTGQLDLALANSRTRSMLKQQYRELETLSYIEQTYYQESEPRLKLQRILEKIGSMVSGEISFFVKEGSQGFEIIAGSVLDILTTDPFFNTINYYAKQVIVKKQTAYSNSPNDAIRSILVAPVEHNDGILGVIGIINSSRSTGFDITDKDFITEVARKMDSSRLDHLIHEADAADKITESGIDSLVPLDEKDQSFSLTERARSMAMRPVTLPMAFIASRTVGFDWKFIRGTSLNSIAIAIGRVLGFAFSFIVAKNFSTSDFGQITYAITLGSIVAILAKPFGQHVAAYYIGKYQTGGEHFYRVMSNVWTMMVILFFLTLAVGIPLLYALNRLSLGVIAVYIGVVVFYTYYGIAGGFQASNRLVAVYISSNVVQMILVIIAIYVLNVTATIPIIMIFGFAYFIPIAVLSWFFPMNVRVYQFRFDPIWIKDILRFSFPIWASHALYVAYYSADIILIERFANESALGIYGLTKTLVSIFMFIPNGITLLLMPKIAGMTSGRKQIALTSITVAVLGNLVSLIFYVLGYKWFVTRFFSDEYFLSLEFALVAALGAIIMGLHTVLTSVFVGLGRAKYESWSRFVMLIAVLISGFMLIPSGGAMGAAWTMLIGAIAGMIVFVIIILMPSSRVALRTPATK